MSKIGDRTKLYSYMSKDKSLGTSTRIKALTPSKLSKESERLHSGSQKVSSHKDRKNTRLSNKATYIGDISRLKKKSPTRR